MNISTFTEFRLIKPICDNGFLSAFQMSIVLALPIFFSSAFARQKNDDTKVFACTGRTRHKMSHVFVLNNYLFLKETKAHQNVFYFISV